MPQPENTNAAPPAIEWKTSVAPIAYGEAVQEMELRVAQIRAAGAPELIWLLEHPPLYTAGASANEGDLLDRDAFPVHRTGRGGQYTYHGPGQRIVYTMLDLQRRGADLHQFVRNLEQWLIDTLALFGVTGERRQGRVGVWVSLGQGKEAKIAAIGIRVRRWVTYHGVSLNVAPDLSHYDSIIACGVPEHGVTSLEALGVQVDMSEVDAVLKKNFDTLFGA
ncbi:MAG: lipoyl(octanoyl) transferase LipB [Proteobacteria bacterium]|nr:lipoyl(octanoyl) transferase LipB [Pseudomonadota bacterium]MDA1355060.1 lipoyl(octanoyl) transferase LipB [Pseudomonadota bacterium]